MVRGRLRWLVFAAAGPVLVLAAIDTGMLAAALVDEDPRWAVAPLDVSEAAAARDAVEMVWLLEQGEDPANPDWRQGRPRIARILPGYPSSAVMSIRSTYVPPDH